MTKRTRAVKVRELSKTGSKDQEFGIGYKVDTVTMNWTTLGTDNRRWRFHHPLGNANCAVSFSSPWSHDSPDKVMDDFGSTLEIFP